MKFLHTADLHFGAGRRLTPKSLKYLTRHIAHLDEVIKIADREKVEFALVCGDVFEGAQTTQEELIAAIQFFQKLGDVCPVICTPGNHDLIGTDQTFHSKNFDKVFQTERLKRLNIPNVHFCNKPEIVGVNSTSVLALPWTGIKDQAEFDAHINKYMAIDVEIVMLHECFKGIVTDVGYKAIGGVQVPDIEQVKYWACGDIHRHQRLNLPNAWYSGSNMQLNFGENTGKGVLIVESEGEKLIPRLVKVPSMATLHQIHDMSEYDSELPAYFQLICTPDKLPKLIPENVLPKVVPPKIKIPTAEEVAAGVGVVPVIQVDYTEGVAELLAESGYTQEEILKETDFVREFVKTY